jgi:uncharacterized protein (DUF58 family)
MSDDPTGLRPAGRPGAPTAAAAAARATVLRRLELEVVRRLDGSASGDHRTDAFGPGSERAGARAYEPGDDARLIDWNLTARAGQVHVRTTEADREVETWVVADRSASLDFGTARVEKRDVVLGATAAFGALTVRGHNRLGLLVCGGARLEHRPARAGRSWLMAVLATVHDTPRFGRTPADGADLASALGRVAVAQHRRSQVVVVSDFLGGDTWQKPLRRLALRHQVLCVHVTDPRELELPGVGILAVVDTETGRQRYVQTSSGSLREKYRAAAAERHAGIVRAVASSGAEYLHLSTGGDWLTDVIRFAQRRRGLRVPAAVERARVRPMAGVAR